MLNDEKNTLSWANSIGTGNAVIHEYSVRRTVYEIVMSAL